MAVLLTEGAVVVKADIWRDEVEVRCKAVPDVEHIARPTIGGIVAWELPLPARVRKTGSVSTPT